MVCFCYFSTFFFEKSLKRVGGVTKTKKKPRWKFLLETVVLIKKFFSKHVCKPQNHPSQKLEIMFPQEPGVKFSRFLERYVSLNICMYVVEFMCITRAICVIEVAQNM